MFICAFHFGKCDLYSITSRFGSSSFDLAACTKCVCKVFKLYVIEVFLIVIGSNVLTLGIYNAKTVFIGPCVAKKDEAEKAKKIAKDKAQREAKAKAKAEHEAKKAEG